MAGGYYTNYSGLLDDVRIYASELDAAADVQQSPSAPATMPSISIRRSTRSVCRGSRAATPTGLSKLPLPTQDGVLAAQSGVVTNTQSSTLSVDVTGPATVTFYWATIANDPDYAFEFDFYLDDPVNNVLDAIGGDTSFYQDGPFQIPPGSHTLGWVVYALWRHRPHAGRLFLDEVSYVPSTPPAITSSPFQSNKLPGLFRLAFGRRRPAVRLRTGNGHEVGSGAIAGATSSYFVPANTGTAGVAGKLLCRRQQLFGHRHDADGGGDVCQRAVAAELGGGCQISIRGIERDQFHKRLLRRLRD